MIYYFVAGHLSDELVEIVPKSRPTWARGLKHLSNKLVPVVPKSRPTWARGLKHHDEGHYDEHNEVAPHVGAWIETFPQR